MFVFLSTAFSLNLFAQDFDKVEIKSFRVTKNIHMLQGAGGNIGVSVGKDGAYLIDDQYAPLNEKIVAAVRKLTDGPIRFVVNTHWHGDHTGGNELLAQGGTNVVAHDNVRKRLASDQKNKLFDRETKASPVAALPVITFPERMTLHLNGEEAQLIHVQRAHTDGDSLVFFPKSNVIHTGDIFFNGSYPFIDLDSGGSLAGMIAAIRKVLAMANNNTKLIPGHGPLATKKDLQASLEMLLTTSSMVEALVKKGKSEKEILAMNPLAKFDKKWGQFFLNTETYTKMLVRLVR